MRRTSFLLAALVAGAAYAQSGTALNAPVPALDLDRYAGTWHEIAHLPMFFQRQCVGDITATYGRRADGDIDVLNSCRTREGVRDAASGVARPVAGTPGALEVSFVPRWLSWVPGVWADYWVIALDPDYRWAMVGGPDREYLWILSREPSMERALYDRLVADARARGYPVDDLILAGDVE